MSENACDRSVFVPKIFHVVAYIYIALRVIVLWLFYLTELAIDSPLTIFKFTFFL